MSTSPRNRFLRAALTLDRCEWNPNMVTSRFFLLALLVSSCSAGQSVQTGDSTSEPSATVTSDAAAQDARPQPLGAVGSNDALPTEETTSSVADDSTTVLAGEADSTASTSGGDEARTPAPTGTPVATVESNTPRSSPLITSALPPSSTQLPVSIVPLPEGTVPPSAPGSTECGEETPVTTTLPGVPSTPTSAVPPWEQEPPRHMPPPAAGVDFDRSVLASERCGANQ
ncbi:MAG: hypothetical protein KAZ88_09055 [Acidimicrobiia bacterium]|nr:hypothetical protein [Acidimicrobiia bacterium]MBP8181126.1 hypothetical protein [Acidimicrobiia bacterium]